MPDEDTAILGHYIRAFLDKEAAESQLRQVMESAEEFDPQLWTRAARELGLQGLAAAHEFGGSDAGLTALGVCFEELGRALVCAPFLSTVALAATALSQLPDTPATTELLTGIADGTCVASIAWSGQDPCDSELLAEQGHIDGVAAVVIDGLAADAILVAARDTTGLPGLYLTRAPFAGMTREPLHTLDLTRRLTRIRFEHASAEAMLRDARTVLARTRDVAWLLLAAEQLGGAQRVLEMALNYAKDRYQFGRAIGSFQAVKHGLADMLVQVESTRSVVYHALNSAQNDPSTLTFEAALARAVASETFLHCAAQNVQIHGGIGFTWEHSAHLYLKRAKSSSLIFGNSVAARRRLAEQLNLIEAAR
jgi:alkylation response protein AidB-like acyl-CoA dehydrogenase